FSEAQARKSELSLDYSFEASPELGLSECKESERYDAVTCMFAVHYFFVAEKALKQFLHNVSINLKPGGYFFGTVPDGRRVNECIRGSLTYQSPMLTVEARWKGSPGCFGSAYICAIGDTVTGSEKGTEGSLEYLVYSNVFVGVAAQYGLVPVLQYDMPSLENVLDPADANKPLKHFLPRFPGSHPSLEQASRLFATFVFQKQGEYPAAEPVADAAPGPNGAVAEPPSYAHPTAALFLVLFKFSAIFYYVLCGLFGTGFVINFCVITFLLVCDFWTVKNVSGRLLVGLRWWNEVSETGGSDWKFESLAEGQRTVNKHDARVFWLVLYITPPLWCLLGLVALLKLNLDYLLLVVIATLLSGANLAGYLKCSKAAQAQLKGVTSGLVSAGIKAYFNRG
ncbi:hypothetical protein APUTEX25_002239, partial [Auxenochlorella protothecoides]